MRLRAFPFSNMALFDTINRAATSAQSTIAQLQGAAAGAANTLINDTGAKCVGVYGQAVVVNIPQPGGGYRQRAQVQLTITQDQLDKAPAAKSRLTRLDVTPPVTYIIDFVNTHGNLTYDLTIVRMGL